MPIVPDTDNSLLPERWAHQSVKTPRITPEIAARVGELHGSGIKLTHALALIDPPIPLNQWKQAFAGGKDLTALSRAYERKVAEGAQTLLRAMDADGPRWQRFAWKLERVLGYTQEKEQVQVNVTNIVGVCDDVVKRARRIAEKRTRRNAKPVDVESSSTIVK